MSRLPQVRTVRNVAPGKNMYCLSFRVPEACAGVAAPAEQLQQLEELEELERREGAEAEVAQTDGPSQKRQKVAE